MPLVHFLRALFGTLTAILDVIESVFNEIWLAIHDAKEGREREEHERKRAALHDTDEVAATNVHLARAGGFPDAKGFLDLFADRYEKELFAFDAANVPSNAINSALIRMAIELYIAEGLHQPLPKPLVFTDAIDEARFRDKVLAHIKKQANPQTLSILLDAMVEAAMALRKLLPPVALADDTMVHIPLADAIPNPGTVIEAFILPFVDQKIYDAGLFVELRKTLNRHVDDETKVMPTKYKGEDIIQTYLKNTPLLPVFEAEIPFSLPKKTRFESHWIVGNQGSGKTTLLHGMVMEDISRNDSSVIIMDSKGQLIEPFEKLACIKHRLVIIDPLQPLAINPLDVPKTDVRVALNTLEYVFNALLETKPTPLQATLFRRILRALVLAFPHPTLETFRDINDNGIAKYDEYIRKLPEDLQDFFYNEFPKKYDATRDQLRWRLDALMDNDTVKTVFGNPITKFNIAKEMDAGKVILIKNSNDVNALGDFGCEFFGRFFISQIWNAAMARSRLPESQKKPCYFYLDEAHTVIKRDTRIPDIIDQCRSQKIALIVSHQRCGQLEPFVIDALANAGIKYANSDADARFLAPMFRQTPDFMRSPNLNTGKFAAFVRGHTPKGIAFTVTSFDFSDMEQLDDKGLTALSARMAVMYGPDKPEPTPQKTPEQPPTIAEGPTPTIPELPPIRSTETVQRPGNREKPDPGEPSPTW
jgi:hypothetical protein